MEETKKWWQSSAEWAAIIGFVIVMLINVLPTMGFNTLPAGELVQAEQQTIIGHILAVGSAVAYAIAFYGRLRATKRIS